MWLVYLALEIFGKNNILLQFLFLVIFTFNFTFWVCGGIFDIAHCTYLLLYCLNYGSLARAEY